MFALGSIYNLNNGLGLNGLRETQNLQWTCLLTTHPLFCCLVSKQLLNRKIFKHLLLVILQRKTQSILYNKRKHQFILLIRPKKNICLFTATRPTLVHFIGKSKVKVDTSEIFGLKKLFPVTSIFLIYDCNNFLRYYNTFTPESNQIYSKVLALAMCLNVISGIIIKFWR